MRSKYHVKWGGRNVMGIAKVEAIAAGCLAISDPALDQTAFLLSPAASAGGFEDVVARIEAFESSPASYRRELLRQRQRVDYLCCHRPANLLLDALEARRRSAQPKLQESRKWA